MTTPEIILASKSPARRTVLSNAGVCFRWMDSDVDEETIKTNAKNKGEGLDTLAIELATAKARVVSEKYPDALVIGCDQLLSFNGNTFDKPETMAIAKSHLKTFQGHTHQLIAAVVIIQKGNSKWLHVDHADLTVRDLSDAFIDQYLAAEGDNVLSSVGAYRLEGRGSQLFENIEGDFFTILGMPLLPLLDELRKRGILGI